MISTMLLVCLNLTSHLSSAEEPPSNEFKMYYTELFYDYYLENSLFIYSLAMGTDEYMITESKDTNAEHIDLPSMIEDFPVTAFGYRLFENHTNLKSTTIPETINSIPNDVLRKLETLDAVYYYGTEGQFKEWETRNYNESIYNIPWIYLGTEAPEVLIPEMEQKPETTSPVKKEGSLIDSLLKFLVCWLGTALTLLFVYFNTPYATSQGLLNSYTGKFRGIFRYAFLAVSYIGYYLHKISELIIKGLSKLCCSFLEKKGMFLMGNFATVMIEFLVYAAGLSLFTTKYMELIASFGVLEDTSLIERSKLIEWLFSLFTYFDVIRFAINENSSLLVGIGMGLLGCVKVGLIIFGYYAVICGYLSNKIVKIQFFSFEDDTLQPEDPSAIEEENTQAENTDGEITETGIVQQVYKEIGNILVSTKENFTVAFTAFHVNKDSFAVVCAVSFVLAIFNFFTESNESSLVIFFWEVFPFEQILAVLATFLITILINQLLVRFTTYAAERSLPPNVLENILEYSLQVEETVIRVQEERQQAAEEDAYQHQLDREEAQVQQEQWDQSHSSSHRPPPNREPAQELDWEQEPERESAEEAEARRREEMAQKKSLDSYCFYLVERKIRIEQLQRDNPNQTSFSDGEIWAVNRRYFPNDDWEDFKSGIVPQGYQEGMELADKYKNGGRSL